MYIESMTFQQKLLHLFMNRKTVFSGISSPIELIVGGNFKVNHVYCFMYMLYVL